MSTTRRAPRSKACAQGIESLRRLRTDLILEGKTHIAERELHDGITDLIRILERKI